MCVFQIETIVKHCQFGVVSNITLLSLIFASYLILKVETLHVSESSITNTKLFDWMEKLMSILFNVFTGKVTLCITTIVNSRMATPMAHGCLLSVVAAG